jgi:hypothetical protein
MPPATAAASPLASADAAPVNLMAQYIPTSSRCQSFVTLFRYIAAAGFVSLAADISLLFPVDVRNASVYVTAAAAVDDGNLKEAEAVLGAAGLWACAAEVHRLYGSAEDFTRVARSHAPHLLSSAAVRAQRQQRQPAAAAASTALEQLRCATGAPGSSSAAAPLSSESDAHLARVAFPAPPLPTRTGLLRARFFIPGAMMCLPSISPFPQLISFLCYFI